MLKSKTSRQKQSDDVPPPAANAATNGASTNGAPLPGAAVAGGQWKKDTFDGVTYNYLYIKPSEPGKLVFLLLHGFPNGTYLLYLSRTSEH